MRGGGGFEQPSGSSGKPLFLAIYAAVGAGVVFSGLFILSSFYSSGFYAGALSSSPSISLSDSKAGNQGSGDEHHHADNHHHGSMWEREIWDAPPKGSKMPPLESFKLTEKLVKPRVKDNVIIVTLGNHAFMDFVLTWVKHLTNLNVTNLLVGAMDELLLEALYWKGIPVYDMGSHMKTIDVGWGSTEFHKMGREKVFLINSLLPFGHEILVCDTDMVWLKNPLPYLSRFPEADILTSSDELVPTVTDDSLEDWKFTNAAFNIGIFHWRPRNSTIKLAKDWKDLLIHDDSIWDQNGFNDLVRTEFGPGVKGKDDLVYAFNRTIRIGILPASIFCSGHTYFVQAQYQLFSLQPYAVHTTFQFGGTGGKRHRLREAMFFYDPPAYYDTPGGFISFKAHVPKALLLDGPHTVEAHFNLVNYQIKQIRTALAIASLLKRTLVMPLLWCRMDRMWFGHKGIIPGTLTRQPFLCPLDHVFEVDAMVKDIPEEEFGPIIHFREHSFFDNPRLPQEVKSSKLEVRLCDEGSESCDSSPGVISLPKNSSEETLVRILSPHREVKVLEFSSMQDAFGGFSSEALERRFRRRMKAYMGIWCCLENLQIGHIYYDMYWDEKPDWRPLPPKSVEADHPPP